MRLPRIILSNLAVLLLCAPGSMPSASSRAALWSEAPTIVAAALLEPGANSVTERQARRRWSMLHLNSVRHMHLDEQGFWRGTAWRRGHEVDVAMDHLGRIAVGPMDNLGRTAPGQMDQLGRIAVRQEGGSLRKDCAPGCTPSLRSASIGNPGPDHLRGL